jgi:hypothetical protein
VVDALEQAATFCDDVISACDEVLRERRAGGMREDQRRKVE